MTLRDFFLHERTLESAHAVDKDDTINMVNFVLQTDRKKSRGMHFKGFTLFVLRFDPDFSGAIDEFIDLREAETAFLPFDFIRELTSCDFVFLPISPRSPLDPSLSNLLLIYFNLFIYLYSKSGILGGMCSWRRG